MSFSERRQGKAPAPIQTEHDQTEETAEPSTSLVGGGMTYNDLRYLKDLTTLRADLILCDSAWRTFNETDVVWLPLLEIEYLLKSAMDLSGINPYNPHRSQRLVHPQAFGDAVDTFGNARLSHEPQHQEHLNDIRAYYYGYDGHKNPSSRYPYEHRHVFKPSPKRWVPHKSTLTGPGSPSGRIGDTIPLFPYHQNTWIYDLRGSPHPCPSAAGPDSGIEEVDTVAAVMTLETNLKQLSRITELLEDHDQSSPSNSRGRSPAFDAIGPSPPEYRAAKHIDVSFQAVRRALERIDQFRQAGFGQKKDYCSEEIAEKLVSVSRTLRADLARKRNEAALLDRSNDTVVKDFCRLKRDKAKAIAELEVEIARLLKKQIASAYWEGVEEDVEVAKQRIGIRTPMNSGGLEPVPEEAEGEQGGMVQGEASQGQWDQQAESSSRRKGWGYR